VTVDELQAFVDRALPPASVAAMEEHFDSCDGCRTLLAAAVRALYPEDDVDADDPTVGDASGLPVVQSTAYAVGEEVAHGGLGRILRARDRRLGRTVAIKELRANARQSERRFVREALITARLEHPSIVPVHEAGRWPSGEPFYSMKLVSGRSLQQAIADCESLTERLALLPSVIAVTEAMAYAHSKSVIHRDLKPSNVMVGEFGETVVVDWGLAKDLRADEADDEPPIESDDTLVGTVLGTPGYMPPEQARGEVVDERADVYALGAILYQLLAGQPPYADRPTNKGSTGGRGPDTRVIAAVLAGPAVPVAELQAGVAPDLLAIVDKAMARAPEDRYPTAKELADDLVKFQTGQLVSARHYASWELVNRWLRRHRLPVAALATALAVAAVIGVISLRRIVAARRTAESAQVVAEQRSAEAVSARRQVETRAYELALLQARELLDRDPTASLAWLKQIPVGSPLWPEARDVALLASTAGYSEHVFRDAGDYIDLRFTPDGRRLASCGRDQRIRVTELATGASTYQEIASETLSVAGDGRMVAAARDGTITVWTAAELATSGAAGRVVGHEQPGQVFVALSVDGRRIASINSSHPAVTVWDAATGSSQALAGGVNGGLGVVLSADGRRVAVAYQDKIIRVWDLAGGGMRQLVGAEPASRIAFSPDGAHLYAAELAGIRDWSLLTGEGALLPLPARRYIAVAASPDGTTVAAGGFEGGLYLLDLVTREEVSLDGHQGMVTGVAFSPDGKLLASTARDHTVRVWGVPARNHRLLGRFAGGSFNPAFSPDGRLVAAGGGDGTIRLWPVAGGPPRVLTGHGKGVFDLAFAPDGRALASQSQDQTVRVWNLADDTSRVVATTAPWVSYGRVQYSPDGRYLACSLDLETLAVLDAATGGRVCTFAAGGFNVAHAFSADSKAIAFTSDDQIRVGELPGCADRVLYNHDQGTTAYVFAFSPDGRWLASASDDRTVGLYDLRSGVGRRLRGHEQEVYWVTFSPDSRTLASASSDRTVRLWDPGTGEPVRVLRGHTAGVGSALFSPDGRVVVSASYDYTLRLWDLASGGGNVLRGHHNRPQGMAFSPAGNRIASASLDGTVRLWPADPRSDVPVDGADISAWLDRATTARIGDRGELASPRPAAR